MFHSHSRSYSPYFKESTRHMYSHVNTPSKLTMIEASLDTLNPLGSPQASVHLCLVMENAKNAGRPYIDWMFTCVDFYDPSDRHWLLRIASIPILWNNQSCDAVRVHSPLPCYLCCRWPEDDGRMPSVFLRSTYVVLIWLTYLRMDAAQLSNCICMELCVRCHAGDQASKKWKKVQKEPFSCNCDK